MSLSSSPVIHFSTENTCLAVSLEFSSTPFSTWASLVAQVVKNPPAMWETWLQPLGWEDPLEKGKATSSSILAWRIPWTIQSQTQLINFHHSVSKWQLKKKKKTLPWIHRKLGLTDTEDLRWCLFLQFELRGLKNSIPRRLLAKNTIYFCDYCSSHIQL